MWTGSQYKSRISLLVYAIPMKTDCRFYGISLLAVAWPWKGLTHVWHIVLILDGKSEIGVI